MPRHLISDAHGSRKTSTSSWCEPDAELINSVAKLVAAIREAWYTRRPMIQSCIPSDHRGNGYGLSPKASSQNLERNRDTQQSTSGLHENENQPLTVSENGSNIQGRKQKGRLWQPWELQKLRDIVNKKLKARKKDKERLPWTEVVREINSDRDDGVERTIHAVKAMVQKLKKLEGIKKTLELANQTGEAEENDINSTTNPNGDDGDEDDQSPTPDPQEEITLVIVEERDLHKEMEEHFNKALDQAGRKRDRIPIPKPKGKIPDMVIKIADELLAKATQSQLPNIKGIGTLNKVTYAAGWAVSAIIKDRATLSNKEKQERIDKNLQGRKIIMSEIQILTMEKKRKEKSPTGKISKKVRILLKAIKSKYGKGKKEWIMSTLIMLKDKLRVIQSRIKENEDAQTRRRIRAQGFQTLRKPSPKEDTPVEQVRAYWEEIVGRTQEFSPPPELEEWRMAVTITDRKKEATPLNNEQWDSIFKKLRPWKAAGPDGIQAFWWKTLPTAKKRLIEWCARAQKAPKKAIASWLCRGRIALIPKEGANKDDPGSYRPIACLNTCYKILTAMMAKQIGLEVRNRIPPEQIALAEKVWGCTHAHILDQTAVKSAIGAKRELHMMWVDMTKAYDSLKHKAIRWCLKAWGIAEETRVLLANLMDKYSVKYSGFQDGKRIQSKTLTIKNGLMQGDTLSPLLFCLVMAPVSHWIRQHVEPYQISVRGGDQEASISHLFYMDDLKIYTRSKEYLEHAKNGVVRVAGSIGLKLNPKKCATRVIGDREKRITSTRVNIPKERMDDIPRLGIGEYYKYLGIEQLDLNNSVQAWKRIEDSCLDKTRNIFLSELTIRQKVDAYNQIVIPRIKYIFSNIIFGQGRLESQYANMKKLDLKVRKILVQTKTRVQNACIARLYVEREQGGLGISKAETAMEDAIVYSWAYIATTATLENPYMMAERARSSNKRSICRDFYTIMEKYGIEDVSRSRIATVLIQGKEYWNPRDTARAVCQLLKDKRNKINIEEWGEKTLAYRVRRYAEEEKNTISLKDSFRWSEKGMISSNVLRVIWAVQEGNLFTKTGVQRKSTDHSDNKCRMACNPNALETPEHIASVCSHWRSNLMVERHNAVGKLIHDAIAIKYGFNTRKRHPEPILEKENVIIYWDQAIYTEKGVQHNRPDIVVWDKKTRMIWVIEISISWYARIKQQEERKILKYTINGDLPENTPVSEFHCGENLVAQLQRDRKSTVRFAPIIIGACGECSTKLRNTINKLKIPVETDSLIERMGRAAALGTYRIVKAHLANPVIERNM